MKLKKRFTAKAFHPAILFFAMETRLALALFLFPSFLKTAFNNLVSIGENKSLHLDFFPYFIRLRWKHPPWFFT